MSPPPTNAERLAAESFYDSTDPLVRAKALYSLLKEMGLPDEYVAAMNYLITEIEVCHHQVRDAKAEAKEIRQWFEQALRQLKELENRHVKPQIIKPSPYWMDNEWGPHRP
jgi:hypothetical protein